MAAVECGAGMRGNLERARRGAALGIDGPQRVAERDPDMDAVISDAVDLSGVREKARVRQTMFADVCFMRRS